MTRVNLYDRFSCMLGKSTPHKKGFDMLLLSIHTLTIS